MLSGVKFIPRDQLLQNPRSDFEDDDDGEKTKKGKSKKTSSSSAKHTKEKKRKGRKSKRRHSSDDDSDDVRESSLSGEDGKLRRRRRKKRENFSDDGSSTEDEGDDKSRKRKEKKGSGDDDEGSSDEKTVNEITRKEMGLEWMLKSAANGLGTSSSRALREEGVEEESKVEELKRTNPRELNPYLKDNQSGYPDETAPKAGGDQLLASSVVGDGGASWRLKALKRAKEQAAREGQNLEEVVGERWGSLGNLAASVASSRAAPSHAHLHAIRNRKSRQVENADDVPEANPKGVKDRAGSTGRDYLRGVSSRHPEMRKPREDSLHWKRNKGQNTSSEDKSLISSAMSSLNKFNNDGSFMDTISRHQSKGADVSTSPSAKLQANEQKEEHSLKKSSTESPLQNEHTLSENQLAAKVLQLRMKGKHEEAEQLQNELEAMRERQDAGVKVTRRENQGCSNRHTIRPSAADQRRREENADLHLAKQITHNKQYSLSKSVDDEYDFDDAPSRKGKRKNKEPPKDSAIPRKLLTQKERCLFCFENPSRPKHLVVSLGNFTYMMLPQLQAVVPGHCIILPLQHEASVRTVDQNVWVEIRNFKKCLLKMFAKQEKSVVFMETVIDLARQRRHCLIECIPIPYQLSEQASMYFKKAIDEAEEEWGQHEMKKVIPTSGNLRQVIPENFAYFHVEFGLDKGFVHVIDDDSNFSSGFGLNVMRGMLRLPEEDMHRRRRHESVEAQQRAVAGFRQEWEPFDWTKELD